MKGRLTKAAIGTEDLYAMFRSVMKLHVEAARGEPRNDQREATQFQERSPHAAAVNRSALDWIVDQYRV